MKKISMLKITMALITGLTICKTTIAQNVYQTQVINIELSGTYNVHDWEMKSIKSNSEASFIVNANDKITSLLGLSFTLPAKNLKSDHTGMDKGGVIVIGSITYYLVSDKSNFTRVDVRQVKTALIINSNFFIAGFVKLII